LIAEDLSQGVGISPEFSVSRLDAILVYTMDRHVLAREQGASGRGTWRRVRVVPGELEAPINEALPVWEFKASGEPVPLALLIRQ
jgi:hypothetical protein